MSGNRIPKIIEASGKSCTYEILSDKDYIRFLEEKLNEELAEYQESKALEKLEDLLEVVCAVVKARGWMVEELEHIRGRKIADHGGFENRILTKEVQP